ncbi:MAG: DUF2304 domain-containing protein [Planctomycetota bacterium]
MIPLVWSIVQGPLDGKTWEPGVPRTIDGLPGHQKTVAILLAAAILLVVVELVRRRKLREEYSLIWTATAGLLLLLALEHRLLNVFMRAIGAIEPTSALFFGALLFLMLVALQFSVRLSKLTVRNRALSQRLALLEQELRELRRRTDARSDAPPTGVDTRTPKDEGDAA